MNASATLDTPAVGRRIDPDRIGIVASILCAIHCAIAPVLLIFAPTFGRWWAHPASHWLIALFVVPLAAVMITRGFRIHRKRWVMASGAAGIALVLVGAALPYTGMANTAAVEIASQEPASAAASVEIPDQNDHETGIAVAATDASETESAEEAEGDCCKDGCCPSLVTDEEDQTRLHIPPASIATTIGGLALILAHIGNVCFCSACRKRKQTGA